jgi:hypothetical protein
LFFRNIPSTIIIACNTSSDVNFLDEIDVEDGPDNTKDAANCNDDNLNGEVERRLTI